MGMNKKGFVKILEAVIAIIIIFIFIFTILPRESKVEKIPENVRLFQERILSEIESNESLRQDVLKYKIFKDEQIKTINTEILSYRKDKPAIDKFIRSNLYPTLDYNYTVCVDSGDSLVCNPDFVNLGNDLKNIALPTNKAVYAKSRIIANSTQTNTFKLYVWENF
jgi:hypothetical protein